MKKKLNYLLLLLTAIFMVGCSDVDEVANDNLETDSREEVLTDADVNDSDNQEPLSEENTTNNADENEKAESKDESKEEADESTVVENDAVVNKPEIEEKQPPTNDGLFAGYKLIQVDGGNLSGHRQANVVVDIGYGDREYWAFTNEHGQLVRVVAEKIILQDDNAEPVKSNGRYYYDEAKVPGVESDVLDEGHVIADSLGGVSNAYNITPQNSTLNRHGDQAYMERAIRDAGGATNFEAIITYPNTKTQIPSSYKYTYTLKGNKIVDTFENVNPDEVNKSLGLTDKKTSNKPSSSNTNSNSSSNTSSSSEGNLSNVDTNGNGKVTIKEAKDAGFKMPITRDHWLYQYMDDRDGDGMVGE